MSECEGREASLSVAERVGEVLAVDVMKMYSPERVAELCGRFGLNKGCSLDLTNCFEFGTAIDRSRAWAIIERYQALLVIGSPPCTDFSMFDELDKNLHRGDPAWLRPFHENLDKAKRHVRCCGTIYKHQVRQGRSFPHEHPWLARSWGMECIKEVEALQGVVRVRLDVFQYGMTSRIDKVGGPLGPVLKPTGMLTNSYCLQRGLSLRCPKNHEHVHLAGGRASAAQEYPKGLCEATCLGLAAQKAADLSRRFITLPMDSEQI